jgi:hypothetical protein
MIDHPERRYVKDLPTKLTFLATHELVRQRHGLSIAALSKACGKSRNWLKTAKDSRRETASIDRAVEQKLGKLCRFDPNRPEWGQGTADEFRKHILSPEPSAGVHSPTLISSRIGTAWSFNPQLASLVLFANQEGGAAAHPLNIELVCVPSLLEKIELSVRRGELILECFACETGNASERKAALVIEGLKRDPPDLEVSVFGTHLSPGWKVHLDRPQKDGWLVVGVICEIRRLEPGSTVTARFVIYVKDLEEKGNSAAAEEWLGRGLLFRGERLSAAKKRILALMVASSCCNDDGYAVIAQDTLRFDRHRDRLFIGMVEIIGAWIGNNLSSAARISDFGHSVS